MILRFDIFIFLNMHVKFYVNKVTNSCFVCNDKVILKKNIFFASYIKKVITL